jgi:tetraacyldisaccharide 4'-kinase
VLSDIAAGIYGGIVAMRNGRYDRGQAVVRRLGAPVVSIGNLSVGGTGKTPAAIAIARGLCDRGYRVDVLTRGYGRGTSELAFAISGDERSALVGDEPRLIALRAGVPVAVSKNRWLAGAEAERRFGSDLHLLDDGFQHRQLARNFDLVLIGARDLRDRLLPAGRLRESPAALRRASAVLCVEPTSGAESRTAVEDEIRRWSSAPVFWARRAPAGTQALPRLPLLAFCGLADPESFWHTLAELRADSVRQIAFRDHHRYVQRDLVRLSDEAAKVGAQAFITTEKDAVKVLELGAAPFGARPLHTLPIELKIEALDQLLDLISSTCAVRGDGTRSMVMPS